MCVSLITVRKTTKRAPLVSPISVWLPGFFFSNLCSSWQGHLQTYGFQHVTLGMEQWVGDCEDFAEILKLDEFEVAPSDLTKAGINLFKQLKVGRNREASKTSLSFNVHVRTTWRHVLRMQSCNIYIYIYIIILLYGNQTWLGGNAPFMTCSSPWKPEFPEDFPGGSLM